MPAARLCGFAVVIRFAGKQAVIAVTARNSYVAFGFATHNVQINTFRVADELLRIRTVPEKIEILVYDKAFQFSTAKEIVVGNNLARVCVNAFSRKVQERHIGYAEHRNVFKIFTIPEHAAVKLFNAFGQNNLGYV